MMLRLRPRLMPRWRLLLVLNGFAATMLLASILKISTQISFREGCRGLGDVTRFPGAQRSWNRGDSQGHPAIALLLSFPNSGTSYTLRLVRSSSLTSTATNYAKETKEARSYIQGRVNETIPTAVYGNERYGTSKNTCPMLHDSSLPRPKEFILTKTHCAGYANMGQSQNSSTSIVVSPREFLMGCVTPFRLANHSNQRNQSSVDKKRKQIKDCPYSPSLVQKAVHIMRSPLDNVVSRYHLWKKNFGTNSSRPGIFNKSASSGVESVSLREGEDLKDWCRRNDERLLNGHMIRSGLFANFEMVPCAFELFLYVQWHNNCFQATSGAMRKNTLFFYYEDFEESFDTTANGILRFLHLSPKHAPDPFIPGKKYGSFFSQDEKLSVSKFIEHFASRETLQKLQRYRELFAW